MIVANARTFLQYGQIKSGLSGGRDDGGLATSTVESKLSADWDLHHVRGRCVSNVE